MEQDLCVASWSVLDHQQPVRLVLHYSDGTWLITDGEADTADQLTTVHAQHLFDDPVQLLAGVRELPPGQEAWREDPSRAWEVGPVDEG